MWGAVLTRYLTVAESTGFGNVKSAGRVQTPTLALHRGARARARRLRGRGSGGSRRASSARCGAGAAQFAANHATSRFKSEADATRAMEAVAGQTAARSSLPRRSLITVKVPVPFNTTLTPGRGRCGGANAGARAMGVAESLYIDGLISYPRVDNTVYPESLDLHAILDALQGVPELRARAAAIASGPLHPTRGEKETTDHPPIHPTGAANQKKLKPKASELRTALARFEGKFIYSPAFVVNCLDTTGAGDVFTARSATRWCVDSRWRRRWNFPTPWRR